MAEGIASGGRAVGGGVKPKAAAARPPEPAPDPERAPRGWRWDSSAKDWVPRKSPGRKKAEPDPEPAHLADEEETPETRPDPVSPAKREEAGNDLAGVLGLVGMILLPGLERLCPYCGSAAAQQYQKIVDATLPLLTRSETVVRWMTTSGGGLLDWLGLGIALVPVANAVLSHHVLKTVHLEDDGPPEDGKPVPVHQDYSDYAAVA